MISGANREEFEQRGRHGVRKQIEHALYDAEKQKQAYEWLDEVERGPDRALAKAANVRATLALVISIISALAAVAAAWGNWAAFFWPHAK